MGWKRKQTTEPEKESINTSGLHHPVPPTLDCLFSPSCMCACWCVHGVGVVSAGVREPLREGYGCLAEERTLDGTFSPHHVCILLGAADTLRFSADRVLLLRSSCVPPFGTHQHLPCSLPWSLFTSTVCNHHLNCPILHTNHTSKWTQQCGDCMEPETLLIPNPRRSDQSLAGSPQQLPASPKSECSGKSHRSQVTVHPRASWMAPIQALSWPQSKW